MCIGQGCKWHSLLCAAAQRGERHKSLQQACQIGVSAAKGAFRLGVFSSATQRTVSAVLPMLEAAAVAGGGPSAPLFSDQRLVLPNVTMRTPFYTISHNAILRPDEYILMSPLFQPVAGADLCVLSLHQQGDLPHFSDWAVCQAAASAIDNWAYKFLPVSSLSSAATGRVGYGRVVEWRVG